MIQQLIGQQLERTLANVVKGQRANGVETLDRENYERLLNSLIKVDPTRVRALVVISVTDVSDDPESGVSASVGLAGTGQILEATLELAQHQVLATQADSQCQCPRHQALRAMFDIGEDPLEQAQRQRGAPGGGFLAGLAALLSLRGNGNVH